ncbi:MAG: thioredoxin-dependent thiol peroxidase [Pseudomonadota bacterium]
MLEEGTQAPDFKLPADDGETFHLGALKGQPVVLFFYPKDDTAGCTKEAVAFSELHDEFKAAGVTVAGLSPDSIASHIKFKKKHELNVTLISDEEKGVLENYGVWVEKSMYGRKYMGVERTTLLIDAAGSIARIWRKVKVPGHAEAVLKAVKELQKA